MFSEALIPFGLHKESNRLVDVGSVAKGKACGCICPSCQTPLIARQGNEKEWHFAHRSHDVHNETRKECDYSLPVSIRMMIRQLSEDGIKFRTPKYEIVLHGSVSDYGLKKTFRKVITEEKTVHLNNVQIGVNFSGVMVDVVGLVNDVPLVLFVTYKDRRYPINLEHPDLPRCGVVRIEVEDISRKFVQEKRGQYIKVLEKYLENDVDGKHWIYHGRQDSVRELAMKERDDWLVSQLVHNRSSGQNAAKEFLCLACNNRWSGTSSNCDKCKTHLYTSEI